MNGRRSDCGLSLVEVLVAVAILAVTLTPLIGLFATSRRNVEDASHRTEALMLARAAIDQVSARPRWADIASEGPGEHPLNASFTALVTVEERTSYLKDVTVRVIWQVRGVSRWVELYSAVYRREGQM